MYRDVFDGRPQLPSPRGPISHAVIKALSHPTGAFRRSARPHRRGTHRRGPPAGALLLLRAALSRVRRRRRLLGMGSRSPTAPQRTGADVRRESAPGAPEREQCRTRRGAGCLVAADPGQRVLSVGLAAAARDAVPCARDLGAPVRLPAEGGRPPHMGDSSPERSGQGCHRDDSV